MKHVENLVTKVPLAISCNQIDSIYIVYFAIFCIQVIQKQTLVHSATNSWSANA